MKTIVIAGKTYTLSENTEAFLRAYLTRVRDFVAMHKLDPDLIFDIEQSIAEKLDVLLAKKKSISEKEAIRIVNELGEPGDIFQELLAEKSQTEQFVNDMRVQSVSLWDKTLGKSGKIFLGVAFQLAQKFEIPVGLMRVTILFLFIIPHTIFPALLFYFGAYFFLNEKTGAKKSVSKMIGNLLRETIRFVERVFRRTIQFVIWLIYSIVRGLSAVWRAIGGFLRFIFFAVLGLIFAVILVAGLFVGPLAFVSLTINNQEIFARVPEYTKWFGLAITLATAVLAIWAIAAAFRARAVPRLVAISAFTIFVGGLFGLIGTGYQTAAHYLNAFPETTTQQIIVPQGEILQISGLENLYGDRTHGLFGDFPRFPVHVQLLPLKSGEPRIELVRSILSKEQSDADMLFQKTTPVQIAQNGDQIQLDLTDEMLFSEPVPFTILTYTIVFYLPESAAVRFADERGHFYLDNVHSQNTQSNWGYYCEDELIFFDAAKRKFVCAPTGDNQL